MANELTLTIVGNLTSDPEMRFTASGQAVTTFTIAHTARAWDRESGQYKDGAATFLKASVWRELAENCAETLTRGMRVIATGKLQQRSFETQQGEKRTVYELNIDEIGPSLRYASARVTKNTPRAQQGQQGGYQQAAQGGYNNQAQAQGQQAQAQQAQAQQGQQAGQAYYGQPSDDPWVNPEYQEVTEPAF